MDKKIGKDIYSSS